MKWASSKDVEHQRKFARVLANKMQAVLDKREAVKLYEQRQKVRKLKKTKYRVSHRYCCNFEVNFRKSGTRYLQKDNVLAKFQSFPFMEIQKTSKKP